MDDTQKMFQKIINGQSSMKSELLSEINKLRKDTNKGFEETKESFRKVNSRIDKLGKSLAYLEDDAPTREEFDGLDKRVRRLEQRTIAV